MTKFIWFGEAFCWLRDFLLGTEVGGFGLVAATGSNWKGKFPEMSAPLELFLPIAAGLLTSRLDELDRRDDRDNDESADLTEICDAKLMTGMGLSLNSLFRRSRLAAGRCLSRLAPPGCDDPSWLVKDPLMCKSPEGVTSNWPAAKNRPPDGVLCTGTGRASGFFWTTTSVLLGLPIAGLETGDRFWGIRFCAELPGLGLIVPAI